MDGRRDHALEEDLPESLEVRPRCKAPRHYVHELPGPRQQLGRDRHEQGVNVRLAVNGGLPSHCPRVVLPYLEVRRVGDHEVILGVGAFVCSPQAVLRFGSERSRVLQQEVSVSHLERQRDTMPTQPVLREGENKAAETSQRLLYLVGIDVQRFDRSASAGCFADGCGQDARATPWVEDAHVRFGIGGMLSHETCDGGRRQVMPATLSMVMPGERQICLSKCLRVLHRGGAIRWHGDAQTRRQRAKRDCGRPVPRSSNTSCLSRCHTSMSGRQRVLVGLSLPSIYSSCLICPVFGS